MNSRPQPPAADPRREHLLTVAVSLLQMGHAADTVAGALCCHEGLSLSQASVLTNEAGKRWSSILWRCALRGEPLPPLSAETVESLRVRVTTLPPGAQLVPKSELSAPARAAKKGKAK